MIYLCLIPFGAYADQQQALFEKGAGLMFSGKHSEAIDIFESIYQETQSPRVKLEWARVAYLDGQYTLSSQLFEEVKDLNPPPEVRSKIDEYLLLMSSSKPRLSLNVSYLYETNPFSIPETQRILILGMPMLYTPPVQQESMLGVKFDSKYTLPIKGFEGAYAEVNLSHVEYELGGNYKSSLGLGVIKYVEQLSGLKVEGARNSTFEKGVHVSDDYAISATYAPIRNAGLSRQTNYTIKLFQTIYPSYPALNSITSSIGASKAFPVLSNWNSQISASMSNSSAKLKSASYDFINLGASTSISHFFGLNASPRLSLSYSHRKHKAIDDMFLKVREDKGFVASMRLHSPWRVGRAYPALEVGKVTNESNIGVYSNSNYFANITLEHNF